MVRIYLDVETYKKNKEGILEPILDAREWTIGATKKKGEEIKYWETAKECWQYCQEEIKKNKKHGHNTYFYAHNMGNYDWYAIARENALDFSKYLYLRPSPIIIEKMEWGQVGAYYLDTMSLFRGRLADIGKTFGYEKLEMPKKITNKEQLKPYLKRDVEIVELIVEKTIENLAERGVRPRKILTAGQLAMANFRAWMRRNYKQGLMMEEGKTIPTKYWEDIKEAYKGGRNEAFNKGKYEKCTYLDLNGLYSWAMIEMRFPDLRTEIKQYNCPFNYLKGKIGIARCTVNVNPECDIGILPIRHQGKEYFPRKGILKGSWTIEELELAEENGYKIEEVEYAITWEENKENPLAGYIKELWELRKSKKGDEEQSIKLLMNNLYGKFAQGRKNKERKSIDRVEIDKYLREGWQHEGTIGAQYVVYKTTGEYRPGYTNNIISTLIAATARIRHTKEIMKIPDKDRLYCDTDSIIFKGNHIDKFKVNPEIGQWKVVEYEEDCIIRKEKVYMIGEDVKMSGVPAWLRTKEAITEMKPIKVPRVIGVGSVLINDYRPEQLGRFREELCEITDECKRDHYLPEIIDEQKREETGEWWETKPLTIRAN